MEIMPHPPPNVKGVRGDIYMHIYMHYKKEKMTEVKDSCFHMLTINDIFYINKKAG